MSHKSRWGSHFVWISYLKYFTKYICPTRFNQEDVLFAAFIFKCLIDCGLSSNMICGHLVWALISSVTFFSERGNSFDHYFFATVICFDFFSWKSFWINHEWNANWRWPCVKWRLPSFLFYLISTALKHIKGERSMHFVHRIIEFRILQTHPHRAVPFQRHAAYLLGMYQFKGASLIFVFLLAEQEGVSLTVCDFLKHLGFRKF